MTTLVLKTDKPPEMLYPEELKKYDFLVKSPDENFKSWSETIFKHFVRGRSIYISGGRKWFLVKHPPPPTPTYFYNMTAGNGVEYVIMVRRAAVPTSHWHLPLATTKYLPSALEVRDYSKQKRQDLASYWSLKSTGAAKDIPPLMTAKVSFYCIYNAAIPPNIKKSGVPNELIGAFISGLRIAGVLYPDTDVSVDTDVNFVPGVLVSDDFVMEIEGVEKN